MAKKAKRLVSESLHGLSTVAGSFTSFRRALAHFPQSPDHRPSIAAIVFVLCEASSEGAGHNFAAGKCPGRYKPAFNFVRGMSCLHHRLARPFIR
jgi:hypothetical protein